MPPYTPAHTDSDISVTFGEADVLHAGDTYWNGIYPFVDYSTGGSINGMIAASDANLVVTTNKTIVIPGTSRSRQQQIRAPGIPRMSVLAQSGHRVAFGRCLLLTDCVL